MMGSLVSNLKILHEIGKGHFGEVFLGEDEVHGEVAVKILRRRSDHSETDWQQCKEGFLREAQYLSRATHPNVVQVYHIVESADGSTVNICMAYCPAGSLQTIIDGGPMNLEQVRKFGTDVLFGISALHKRGMLHRDIKPSNILLNRKGNAQISDFGLVTDELIFGYAGQAGYYDHIAFEVWQGEGTSAKSDIWAFGMTLYRLLHGQQWYDESPRPRDIVSKGKYSDSLNWMPHVPRSWRRVVRKMLRDDTASRFQNADQVQTALAQLPVAPVWNCDVQTGKVTWTQEKGNRRIVVDWFRHSPKKHEWNARSEPIGKGRIRNLGGSEGVLGNKQVRKELEEFFRI